ncbi:MAG: lytic transglycosylase domain-containing protein [Aestuariibacter sp.]|nr:lytic transglycosylase domain-containing protein [Aestuariibacter sp.]
MLLTSQGLLAAIYKYEDRKGHVYFTNRTTGPAGYRLVWQSGATKSSRSTGRSRINTGAMGQNRRRFTPLIDVIAKETRIRPELLHAVVRAESAYDPQARSRTGAVGLMQLMPGTAKRYGVTNSLDPKENLQGGARYLSDLLKMFKFDLRLALAAYNAGENAVIKYGNTIPPYPETQTYVSRVLGFYQTSRDKGS